MREDVIEYRKRRKERLNDWHEDERKSKNWSVAQKADYLIRNGKLNEKIVCSVNDEVIEGMLQSHFDSMRDDEEIWRTTKSKNGEGGKHYAIETETGEITKGNIGQGRTGKQEPKSNKQKQLDYILKINPMRDDYHTGIRELSDVKTFEEALDYEEPTYPDITEDIIENAKKTGKIKVYSSKDIKGGGFITPSKMMAKDYAGGGDVKELEVDIDDVAWINGDEGVYAPKSELGGEVKRVEMPEKQKKALDAVIKKTANLKNEQSRIIDTDGNVLVEAKGGKHSVAMTVGQKRKYLKGNIIVHNHPEGGTFSADDLDDFGYGATEMVVACPEGTYSLVNDKVGTKEQYDGWLKMRDKMVEEVPQEVSFLDLKKRAEENLKDSPELKKMDEISKEWVRMKDEGASREELDGFINDSGYDEYRKERKRKFEEEIRRLEVAPQHEWLEKNANKFGFTYKFEPNKKKTRKDSMEFGKVDYEEIIKHCDNLIKIANACESIKYGNEKIREKLEGYFQKALDGTVAKMQLFNADSAFFMGELNYVKPKSYDVQYPDRDDEEDEVLRFRQRREERLKKRLDEEKEPESWITVRGNHIPIDEEGKPVGGQMKVFGDESEQKKVSERDRIISLTNKERKQKAKDFNSRVSEMDWDYDYYGSLDKVKNELDSMPDHTQITRFENDMEGSKKVYTKDGDKWVDKQGNRHESEELAGFFDPNMASENGVEKYAELTRYSKEYKRIEKSDKYVNRFNGSEHEKQEQIMRYKNRFISEDSREEFRKSQQYRTMSEYQYEDEGREIADEVMRRFKERVKNKDQDLEVGEFVGDLKLEEPQTEDYYDVLKDLRSFGLNDKQKEIMKNGFDYDYNNQTQHVKMIDADDSLLDKIGAEEIERWVMSAFDYFPSDWMDGFGEKELPRIFIYDGYGRGFCNGKGVHVYIKGLDLGTDDYKYEEGLKRATYQLVHEMGHWMENVNADIGRRASNYLSIRIGENAGNKIIRDSCICYTDGFFRDYMGKIYSDGSTEITSMLMQSMVAVDVKSQMCGYQGKKRYEHRFVENEDEKSFNYLMALLAFGGKKEVI